MKVLSFILILGSFLLNGCTDSRDGQSSVSDVRLRSSDGSWAVVYREGEVVKYRSCLSTSTALNRDCETNRKPLTMSQIDYFNGLTAAMSVDPDVIAFGNPVRLIEQIEQTKKDIASGSLRPDESEKATEYLQRLETNKDRSIEALEIVSKLAAGDELVLNENYSNNYLKVLEPFKSILTPERIAFVTDETTGLAWVRTRGCWYDMMDLTRPDICYAPEMNRYSGIRLREGDAQYEVSPGCFRKFGPSWSLPTYEQLYEARKSQPDALPSFTNTGRYILDDWKLQGTNFGNIMWPKTQTFDSMTEQDRKLSILKTACVAKVKDVDPQGDVDRDGILNSQDQCNRVSADRRLEVAASGTRIGCAPGQKTDAEIESGGGSSEGGGVTEGGTEMATWIPKYEGTSRYKYFQQHEGQQEVCVTSSGYQGRKFYFGWFDTQWTRPSGAKGAWIKEKSQWSACQ